MLSMARISPGALTGATAATVSPFSFSPLPQNALVKGDMFNVADRITPAATAASTRTTTLPFPITFSSLPGPGPHSERTLPP
jgi:hypothetical protein